MSFVVFSFHAKKDFFKFFFYDFEFVFVHWTLTIFIMPAVITQKTRQISNQSQRAISPEVTCAV